VVDHGVPARRLRGAQDLTFNEPWLSSKPGDPEHIRDTWEAIGEWVLARGSAPTSGVTEFEHMSDGHPKAIRMG
jgi:hypothetical protein